MRAVDYDGEIYISKIDLKLFFYEAARDMIESPIKRFILRLIDVIDSFKIKE
jgi:hypothetical protein